MIQVGNQCRINIEKVDDDSHLDNYRFGTVFLAGFYTTLDYEKNQVFIGVNKPMSSLVEMQFERDESDIDQFRKSPATTFLTIMLVLVVMLGVAVVVWQKKKHDGERADMVQARMLFVE